MRAGVAMARAAHRVRSVVAPAMTVVAPPAGVERVADAEVPMRDGVALRVDVYRPTGGSGPWPVIACAHPYGKDRLPRPRRRGGWRVPGQARAFPQSVPYRISAWTSWEAPDPATWVPRGFVVVNADLRGWGRSDGRGELLSSQEGRDVHDLVGWIADQPWSDGRVALMGVSYLAITQWRAAAEQPPALVGIVPWEGFTDPYRDLLRPGGIRERGFSFVWTKVLERTSGRSVDLRRQQRSRRRWDEWWEKHTPVLDAVDVPVLVCGSFSDHLLHSGGSFRGWSDVASADRWLFTHRGPKWSTFYGPDAVAAQAEFLDHVLTPGAAPRRRVRLEVREDADTVVAVRQEDDWPLPGTAWTALHLDAATATLARTAPTASATAAVRLPRRHVAFRHHVDQDVELSGPMVLRLPVSLAGAGDASVFVGVRKRRPDGRPVGFEGSYGDRYALVTCGFLRVSHRTLDPDRSQPWLPVHDHAAERPVVPGEVAVLDIPLLPSATWWRAGDELELLVGGRWWWPRNPLTGAFPAAYEPSRPATLTVHTGGRDPATLLVPVVPPHR